MRGSETARKIRSIEKERITSSKLRTPDCVIIALTASTMAVDYQLARESGCNDFLVLPLSVLWLEKKLREWTAIYGPIDYGLLEETAKESSPDSVFLLFPRQDSPEKKGTGQESRELFQVDSESRLEVRLYICEESHCQLWVLIGDFLLELSHFLATLQDFVEDAMLASSGSLLTAETPSLTSAFVLCDDLLKSMAARIDQFENTVRLGKSMGFSRSQGVLSPGDLNQQIADVSSLIAAPKDVEIVVRNPQGSLFTTHFELQVIFCDQDFVRQLLLYLLLTVIRKVPRGTVVEQNCSLEDIRPDADMTTFESQGFVVPIEFRLMVIFQIKFSNFCGLANIPGNIDPFYLTRLRERGDFIVNRVEGQCEIVEVHIQGQGIPFVKISRMLGYFESVNHFPYTLSELQALSRKMKDYKILILSSKASVFINNLVLFLQSWQADLSIVITGTDYELMYQITQTNIDCSRDNEDKHARHLMITDQVEFLDRILPKLAEPSRFNQVIVFTSITAAHSAKLQVDLICREIDKRAPHTLVMTKPCGPERLLFAIHLSEDGSQGRHETGPTLRLATEMPPFDEFPQLSRPIETYPPRLKTRTDVYDLSRFVNVLLVEGLFYCANSCDDQLILYQTMSPARRSSLASSDKSA